MKNTPKEIFIQVDSDGERPEDFKELYEVTWCADRINKTDVRYVLATSEACKKDAKKLHAK